MSASKSRREFLAEVGRGMLVASVGYGVASELGLSRALAGESESEAALDFGPLEPLVRVMVEAKTAKQAEAVADQQAKAVTAAAGSHAP